MHENTRCVRWSVNAQARARADQRHGPPVRPAARRRAVPARPAAGGAGAGRGGGERARRRTEAEAEVVVDGVRHARGSLILAEPTPERMQYRLDERALFQRYDARQGKWVPKSCPTGVRPAHHRGGRRAGLPTLRRHRRRAAVRARRDHGDAAATTARAAASSSSQASCPASRPQPTKADATRRW